MTTDELPYWQVVGASLNEKVRAPLSEDTIFLSHTYLYVYFHIWAFVPCIYTCACMCCIYCQSEQKYVFFPWALNIHCNIGTEKKGTGAVWAILPAAVASFSCVCVAALLFRSCRLIWKNSPALHISGLLGCTCECKVKVCEESVPSCSTLDSKTLTHEHFYVSIDESLPDVLPSSTVKEGHRHYMKTLLTGRDKQLSERRGCKQRQIQLARQIILAEVTHCSKFHSAAKV